jgi:hypothetical protein
MLSAAQYTELLVLVERATTKDELRREMTQAAAAWGSKLDFDTVI